MTPDLRSRFRGCLLGGAVGDALGAAVEFHSLDEIRTMFGPSGITSYAESYDRLGAITDDTQMTLFTAEGLLRARRRLHDEGVSDPPSVIANAYARWLRTQGFEPAKKLNYDGWLISHRFLFERRAPGGTCVSALCKGTGQNGSKGCGGVMRVAPVGLALGEPFELARDAAAITHGHPTGSLAAGAFAEIVARITRHGDSLGDAIESALAVTSRYEHHEETTEALRAAVRAAGSKPPTAETVESVGAGWIAEEALAVAVYCALAADDFRSGVVLAVNHSGDSDSTGAIAGNLLGALEGASAIPEDLLEPLEGRDVIEQVADDLHATFVENAEVDGTRYPGW